MATPPLDRFTGPQKDPISGSKKTTTVEVIEAINNKSQYYVRGAWLQCSGLRPDLKVGDQVQVAWTGDQPTLILGHVMRRGRGPINAPQGKSVVEELLIFDGVVWFRNGEQLTQLKVDEESIPPVATPALGVRWGLDRRHFHVVSANHEYRIYRISRSSNKILGVGRPRVTFVSLVKLEEFPLVDFFTFDVTRTFTWALVWLFFNSTTAFTESRLERTLVDTTSGTFTLKPDHFMHLSGAQQGQFKGNDFGSDAIRTIVTDAVVNSDGHLLVGLSMMLKTTPVGTASSDGRPWAWFRRAGASGNSMVGMIVVEPGTSSGSASAISPASFEHHGFFINASLGQVLWRSLPDSYTAARTVTQTFWGPSFPSSEVIADNDPAWVSDPGPPIQFATGPGENQSLSSNIFYVPTEGDAIAFSAGGFSYGADTGGQAVVFEQHAHQGHTFFDPTHTPWTPRALEIEEFDSTTATSSTNLDVGNSTDWKHRVVTHSLAERYFVSYQIRSVRILRWHANPSERRILVVLTSRQSDDPFLGGAQQSIFSPERLWIHVLNGVGTLVKTVVDNELIFSGWWMAPLSISATHVLLTFRVGTSSTQVNVDTQRNRLRLIDLQTGAFINVVDLPDEENTVVQSAVEAEIKVFWPRYLYAARETKRWFLRNGFNPTTPFAPKLQLAKPNNAAEIAAFPPEDARFRRVKALKNLIPQARLATRNTDWVNWWNFITTFLTIPSADTTDYYQPFEWQAMPPMDIQLIVDRQQLGPTGQFITGPAYDGQTP